MISSDMEEVIGVSDRIVVMHEGAISGTLNRDQFSEENVMRLAVGTRSGAECGVMLKKDLGLFLLILVVGAVVAFLNPRFISPINLANTANLVGLFGLFSIGEGFVIITGGIDLSIGSVFALFGVVFVDLLVNYHVPWILAVLIIIGFGVILGWVHGFLDHANEPAALRRDPLRPADLSRRSHAGTPTTAPRDLSSARAFRRSNGSPPDAPTASRTPSSSSLSSR